MSGKEPNRVDNHILRTLPRAEYQRVVSCLEDVHLEFKQVLSESRVPIERVYFPTSAVLSWRTLLEDGSGVEVATIGKEGMTGFCTLLGAESAPANVIVQVPGEALTMKADEFIATCKSNRTFSRLLNRYFNAFLIQVIQSVACNAMHPLEQRFCRWLLMTYDRIQADQVPLTHELLAQMLGVRRASVTEAARKLQNAGLIRYVHGKITVLDRKGLESASCECYHTVKKEFDSLLKS